MSIFSSPLGSEVEHYFQPFQQILSKPQYAHFYRLVLSLLISLHVHRVTDAMRWWNYVPHWTNVYWFLRTTAWEATQVTRCLFELIQQELGKPRRLYAVVDDSIVRHAGAKQMAAVRCYRNPSAQNDSCRAKAIFGHQWVLVAQLPLSPAVILTVIADGWYSKRLLIAGLASINVQ